MKPVYAAVMLGTVLAIAPVASYAQQSSPPAIGQWHYTATIYGYLPGINSKSKFPVDSGGGTVNITGKDIVNALQGTVMGSLEANNGRWGIFSDLLYVKVGGSKSNSREFSLGDIGIPAGTTANLDWNLRSEVWTTAGTYRLVSDSNWTVDALAGARLFATREKLNYSLTGNIGPIDPAARSGSKSISDNVWAGVVGVKGRYAFGPSSKWALPFYLDAGTGGEANTVQAAAGASYAFGWGELNAQWRYVGYHSRKDGAIQSISLRGPQIGGVFRW